MTLNQKIDYILEHCNEVAFGYSDSGVCWRIQYGPRGVGSMMDGFGQEWSSTEIDNSGDFESAIDAFIEQMGW